MPLAPFSFVDGIEGKSPRETKPRAAVAGLLSVGIVGQDALKWASTLGTWVLPSTWPVWPRRRRGGAVAKR
ncbi:hypothetical protein G5B00_14600 [Parapedobacter sp. SGR-10]|uniref:hypothetical protein n=1 Tax=Parapedobacter sp. SGR-10 TaxID=2710879 RepID=UPI0013D64AB1|nr:hypothetical protein [Parapedobacter sp. SGR-10]NGF57746.1 hypothetical protein [Parapedobacter sp. SGR-10]